MRRRVQWLGTLTSVLVALLAPREASADLAAAQKALLEGSYAAAEKLFRTEERTAKRGAALVGLARTLLETGRAAEAARNAEAAAGAGAAAEGNLVRAEALHASGDRDRALAILRRLATDPSAFRARMWLARLLSESGDEDAARDVFRSFVDDYNADRIAASNAEALAYVAEAVVALGSFREGNQTFLEAVRADPRRVETNVRWAALFLRKYDAGHAEECLQDALEVNAHHAEAHLLYARVKMEQGFDFRGAYDHLDEALETNPNLAAAHAMRAELALMDQDDDAAASHLESARRANPRDPYSLAVAAVARWVVDDDGGFRRAKDAALRAAPTTSPLWEVLARLADWEHRYDEAIALMEEALRGNPRHPTALATIGLNRLRMGDENRGLDDLRRAWSGDRYNVLVYNTLNLYEEVIAKKYTTVAGAHHRLRMDVDERPVLERYVPQMIERAWSVMTKRYRFEPSGPIQVELYSDAQHFAVRTSGLPDIGVQGVCFGKVVTALSPTAGSFNWGQIVWHEVAHVFSIQASRARVPRWFTEGLAEWETVDARPEWARENDDDLYRAVEGGHLPSIGQLNNAFTHARSGEEVLVAYYAASRVVKYVIDRWGFEKVLSMLRLWGRGKRTPTVVREALGVSIDELDRDFRRATLERLARYRNDFGVAYVWAADVADARRAADAAPLDRDAQLQLGLALMRVGDRAEAKDVLERVLQRDPPNRTAHFALSDLALADRDLEGARRHAREVLASGTDSYKMRMNLAAVAKARGRDREYGLQICLAWRLDPERREALELLRAWLDAAGRSDRALARLEDLVLLDQHDREAMGELLPILRQRGRWEALRRFAENALYLDPHNAEVHRLLGEAHEHAGERQKALFEYESALLCDPDDPAPIQNAINRLRGRPRRSI